MKQSFSYTLFDLATRVEAEFKGDAGLEITGLNTLQDATGDELSFLANRAYARYLKTTKAGAVILAPDEAEGFEGNAIIAANPYLAYAHLSHLFDKDRGLPHGIHESASVHPSAIVDETAAVGPNAVIEQGAILGAGVRIDAGAVVGHDSIIGENSQIGRNAIVCHGVVIGKRVIIHAGAVIGADGFGNAHAQGKWHKIAQIGGVIIGDDVEIGSCTCIDRGALGDTIIEDGVRLDNLIQIAHNVVVGKNTAMAANVGVSGSTRIGSNCIVAGATGIAGHLTIADGVHFGGMSMVTKSVTEPGAYASGTGLMDAGDWRRNVVRFRKLDEMAKTLRKLEKKLTD